MYVLKGLYLEYKVKAYEKSIRSLMKARDKLKERQAKMTKSYESYVIKLKEHRG